MGQAVEQQLVLPRAEQLVLPREAATGVVTGTEIGGARGGFLLRELSWVPRPELPLVVGRQKDPTPSKSSASHL
jgi:hypothetical protein